MNRILARNTAQRLNANIGQVQHRPSLFPTRLASLIAWLLLARCTSQGINFVDTKHRSRTCPLYSACPTPVAPFMLPQFYTVQSLVMELGNETETLQVSGASLVPGVAPGQQTWSPCRQDISAGPCLR